jgi:hypothetical protein
MLTPSNFWPVAAGSERPSFHESGGFLGHAVFDVLVRDGGVVVEVFELPRGDEAAGGAGAGPVGEIDGEGVFQRRVGLRAEVPFSEVAGGVSGGFEALGERRIGGFEAADGFRGGGLGVRGGSPRGGGEDDLRQVAVGRGDAGARGAEAGENGGAGGGAERAGGVGAVEGHAALGEAFEAGGLIEFGVAVERGVRPAEVVGEDEHNVGFPYG